MAEPCTLRWAPIRAFTIFRRLCTWLYGLVCTRITSIRAEPTRKISRSTSFSAYELWAVIIDGRGGRSFQHSYFSFLIIFFIATYTIFICDYFSVLSESGLFLDQWWRIVVGRSDTLLWWMLLDGPGISWPVVASPRRLWPHIDGRGRLERPQRHSFYSFVSLTICILYCKMDDAPHTLYYFVLVYIITSFFCWHSFVTCYYDYIFLL